MDGELIQNIIGVIAIFLLPMIALTIILTTRMALKPLVETLAKALRDSGLTTSSDLASEVTRLSEQVEALTDHVHRLDEAQQFDRKLLEAPTEEVGVLR